MTFVFVSGRLSLDYLGTVRWRRRPEPEEQLVDPAALARWTVAAGVVDRAPAVDAATLAGALAVREALYRVIDARRTQRSPRRADVATVNEVAARPPVARRLGGTGRVRVTGDAEQVLSTVAADALDLLADEVTLDRLRECANPDCTRLYVDTSRGRTRRWCGMAECGNRAKAARFRQRHATT